MPITPEIVRSRVGAFRRGSAAPVSAFCVGSVVSPEPADVSSVIASPPRKPLGLPCTALLLNVVVPGPPWRAPIPSHHWLQSLEMSSSRKNAVCGRSSSPSWFGG